jgi:hemerythrin-like domain-containing protein
VESTDELRAEHEGVRVMLSVIRAICRRLGTDEAVDPSDLPKVIEFLSVFVDRCHHGKEEDLLFPALEAAGVARDGGPIGVMLAEHAEGRELIRAMREALERWDVDPPEARRTFAARALAYADLLEEHIGKENGVLFVAAEAMLTPEADGELAAGFEAIERERIGAGKHEEFHALLDVLSARYN